MPAIRLEPRASRLASELLAFALGLNVWVTLVLLPGLFVGAFRRSLGFVAAAPLALVALGIGTIRRSAPWLLVAFPAALVLPPALDPRIVGDEVHTPLTFALLTVGLVGFLLGACAVTRAAEREREPAAPEERRRRLSTAAAVAPRWRRRLRVYRLLAALSVVFPPVLLYAVNFSPETRAYRLELYGERAAGMTALMNLGLLLVWAFLWRVALVGPLRHHRSGDRALARRLERIRVGARRGTPRPAFYFAVLCALALMGLLFHVRYG